MWEPQQTAEDPQPSITRLPPELRLEIWKHYFATHPFEPSKRLQDLPGLDEIFVIKCYHPNWITSFVVELSGPPEKLFVPGGVSDRELTPSPRHLQNLTLLELALLQTCRLLRHEALPLYLEALRARMRSVREEYLGLLLEKRPLPTRPLDWIGKYQCRLVVLDVTIEHVKRRLTPGRRRSSQWRIRGGLDEGWVMVFGIETGLVGVLLVCRYGFLDKADSKCRRYQMFKLWHLSGVSQRNM